MTEPRTLIKVGIVVIILTFSLILVFNISAYKKRDYVSFFEKNQNDLTKYAEQFANQSNIASIRRDEDIFGLAYGVGRFYLNTHQSITYEIPRKYRKNEDEFWQQDSSQIVSTKGTGSISLDEFLQDVNMTESNLHDWRKFLKTYNFYYIDKDKSNKLVIIGLTPKTGFIYRTDINTDPKYREEKLVKFNDNWFYFDERAK